MIIDIHSHLGDILYPNIRKLIRAFGPEKVMYASGRPWGLRLPHSKTVKVACKGDVRLERMLFYENAAELLNINA